MADNVKIALMSHPTVLAFLEFVDSILHSIQSNKIALQPDVKADANIVYDLVNDMKKKVMEKFVQAFQSNSNVLLQNIDLEAAAANGHVDIGAIVNKHTVVADVIAKYTASTLQPVKRGQTVAGATNSHYAPKAFKGKGKSRHKGHKRSKKSKSRRKH